MTDRADAVVRAQYYSRNFFQRLWRACDAVPAARVDGDRVALRERAANPG